VLSDGALQINAARRCWRRQRRLECVNERKRGAWTRTRGRGRKSPLLVPDGRLHRACVCVSIAREMRAGVGDVDAAAAQRVSPVCIRGSAMTHHRRGRGWFVGKARGLFLCLQLHPISHPPPTTIGQRDFELHGSRSVFSNPKARVYGSSRILDIGYLGFWVLGLGFYWLKPSKILTTKVPGI